MLWSKNEKYYLEPFELEKHLEESIIEVQSELFGKDRIYLDTKKMIGKIGGVKNVPDGYLIDLSSQKEPNIFVVENELIRHDHLKHIAVQILEFSLSYETTPLKVKEIIKNALYENPSARKKCELYAKKNGYENLDYLLEAIIIKRKDSFKALLIIDDISDTLETVLTNRFKFPVEIITLRRYRNKKGHRLHEFEPFMADITYTKGSNLRDLSECDTIVVAARKDGFNDVFLDSDCWYAIRISSTMIPRIKYIAGYQTTPISAITHLAEIDDISHWKDSSKYIVRFKGKAKKIRRIKLGKRAGAAPQSPRYTSLKVIKSAKTLDDIF